MLVDVLPAAQEILEVLCADGDDERQADRRPHGITPADPVPEAEDAIRSDAEFGDLVEPGGDGREMVRHGGLAQRIRHEFSR